MNEMIKPTKTRISFKTNVPDKISEKIINDIIINPEIIGYLPDTIMLTAFGSISTLKYGIR